MKTPFVVLTGFLGAGKTTLVNALLARRAARGDAPGKLGVIVNELGAIGIDGALIGDSAARQVELPGGCVCCALGDELSTTLRDLTAANPDLDAILLETTGVAEPLPIAWAVADGPVRLAAVVTVVDASNFIASRPVSSAVDAQVVNADVLLVTKAEVAGPEETGRVESEIRTLAPRSLLQYGTTVAHAAWLEALLADPPTSPIGEDHDHDPHHVHDESCRHADTPRAHGIDSVWIPAPGVFDLEELEDALAALPPNYVRIKGIVRAIDGRVRSDVPRWTVVHRVGPRVSSEPLAAMTRALAPAEDGPDSESARIVALGPDVDRQALATCMETAASALLTWS